MGPEGFSSTFPESQKQLDLDCESFDESRIDQELFDFREYPTKSCELIAFDVQRLVYRVHFSHPILRSCTAMLVGSQ